MAATPNDRYLVRTDIDAIQAYVFRSVRLATISGASEIVRSFDNDLSGRGNADTQIHTSAGGACVASFSSQNAAKNFIANAACTLATKSRGSAHLSASDPEPFDPLKPDDVQAALERTAWTLERNKRRGHAGSETPALPMAEPCDACGVEPADQVLHEGMAALGPSCRAALDARRKDPWWWPLVPPASAPLGRAQDFNELASGGYLAILVADGNAIGERLRQLRRLDEYEQFSRGLDGRAGASLQAGLTLAAGQAGKEGSSVLPADVLYAGGDDMVLACRGDLALPIAQALAAEFGRQWCGQDVLLQGLSLSVAAVISRSGFPFRTAHRIGSALLHRAKRAARDAGVGAVDYAVVTEAHAGADRIIEDQRVRSPDGSTEVHLTGRPYLAGANTTQGRAMENLRDAVTHLTRLPRGKLYELRGLCSSRTLLPPGGSVTVADVNAIREHLGRELAAWIRRIRRRGDYAQEWTAIAAVLDIGDDGFFRRNRNRTPMGDLADLLGLWGSGR